MAGIKPGTRETVLDPILYWGLDDRVKYPGREVPYQGIVEGDVQTGGLEIVDDTQNGVLIGFIDTDVMYASEERGPFATLRGEDFGATIAFNDRSPSEKIMNRLLRMNVAGVTADATGTVRPAARVRYPTFKKRREIAIVVDGWCRAGGMFTEDTHVRVIAHRCNLTANLQLPMRWRGGDSAVQFNNAFRCMPNGPTPAVQCDDAKLRAELDPEGRLSIIDIPQVA